MKSQETRRVARANEKKEGEWCRGARQYLAFEMEAKSRVKVGLDQKPAQVSLAKEPGWQSVGGPHLGTHKNWTQIQVVRSVMQQGGQESI